MSNSNKCEINLGCGPIILILILAIFFWKVGIEKCNKGCCEMYKVRIVQSTMEKNNGHKRIKI